FLTLDHPVETTYENFENLDCYSNHVHDYLKYCKYGFGRATDNACLDIRLGYISREEGVRLVQKYDGKPPKKAIKKYLEFSGFSEEEFQKIVDSFTNKKIFKRDENGKFIRDYDGSLVRKDECVLK
ncbi:N-acetyl sugar amidotransferase, partial [Campylobacter jejuni]|nr:N-acetyl sugar amidotransferase [Campylobacter jejuni]EAL4058274.1 N-acetyl sugar amidotransferase [Campylobacter jejuni]